MEWTGLVVLGDVSDLDTVGIIQTGLSAQISSVQAYQSLVGHTRASWEEAKCELLLFYLSK